MSYSCYTKMSVARLTILYGVVSFFITDFDVHAQTIDYYKRFSDPRAITSLDSRDNGPVRTISAGGWPTVRDPIDNYFVMAEDSGAGIITHFAFEYPEHPNARLRIRVDDSLIVDTYILEFFRMTDGAFRPPLTGQLSSNMFVCNVQIPYKRNFRMTFDADWNMCCLAWNIEYRQIKDPDLVESFTNPPSASYYQSLKKAEDTYVQSVQLWQNAASDSVTEAMILPPKDTLILLDTAGPAMIRSLRLVSSTIDTSILRQLFLTIWWDGSDRPSVFVPLADFFAQGGTPSTVTSLPIQATTGGDYLCQFPMPFALRCRIGIVNYSAASVYFFWQIHYNREPVDRTQQGYFTTVFDMASPATLHKPYSTSTIYGRGKYVGAHIGFPQPMWAYVMGGKTSLFVDTISTMYNRYNNLFHYINAISFFPEEQPFSLPFSGCPTPYMNVYRYHYLDAFDFDSSFTFQQMHAIYNDAQVDIRSVLFFYKEWTPFWTERDTVRAGESLRIRGTGYAPNIPIKGTAGSTTLFETNADAEGAFSVDITIPESVLPHTFFVSVNDVRKPEPMTYIEKPMITIVRDSIPYIFRATETIRIRGNGFDKEQQIFLFIDTVLVGIVTADNDHRFDAIIRMPYLSDGEYEVTATYGSDVVAAEKKIRSTKIITIECEQLPIIHSSWHSGLRFMAYSTDTSFSSHKTMSLQSEKAGDTLQLRFSIPVSDTFAIDYYVARGRRYGIYDIFLDSQYTTTFDGFSPLGDLYAVKRSEAIPSQVSLYLAKGEHIIEFIGKGKAAEGDGYALDADNIILRPLGTPQYSVTTDGAEEMNIIISPNPSYSSTITIYLTPSGEHKNGTLKIVNINGTLHHSQTVILNGMTPVSVEQKDLQAGTYFCLLTMEGKTYLSRFVVLR